MRAWRRYPRARRAPVDKKLARDQKPGSLESCTAGSHLALETGGYLLLAAAAASPADHAARASPRGSRTARPWPAYSEALRRRSSSGGSARRRGRCERTEAYLTACVSTYGRVLAAE
eukprot:361837-Chlamydomonas_euryale.AAC.2